MNADDPPVRYDWPAGIALDRRGSVEDETCGPDDRCEAARESERKCAEVTPDSGNRLRAAPSESKCHRGGEQGRRWRKLGISIWLVKRRAQRRECDVAPRNDVNTGNALSLVAQVAPQRCCRGMWLEEVRTGQHRGGADETAATVPVRRVEAHDVSR